MTRLDVHDADRVHDCPPALAPFVEAGVLVAADVHAAGTLCRVLGEDDPDVLLAAALAVRAPRNGHVCVDLADAHLIRGEEPDQVPLPWPDPAAWKAVLVASPAVTTTPDVVVPLVLEGDRLYLHRFHAYECEVAVDLARRATAADVEVDEGRLAAMLERLFRDAEPGDRQRAAADAAVRRRLTVVAGGPGTGKTWTVARILAALVDQAVAQGRELHVGLAAPTGKAAARLEEGLRAAVREMDLDDEVRSRVDAIERGRTLHSLLGVRSSTRFWHDRDRPLPHDVIVVDEMSMASLSLVAHLLRAVRDGSRLVLVGDPGQLASVEAGTVLGDLVGPTEDGLGSVLDGAVVVLDRPRRFGADSGVGQLARAIRAADTDEVLRLLATHADLGLRSHDDAAGGVDMRDLLVERGRRVADAARSADVDASVKALGEVVVLCAHRRGLTGVSGWNAQVDQWLQSDLEGWNPWDTWQPGRAVLVTENDRTLGVFNGDIGVVVADADRPRVAFDVRDEQGQRVMVDPVRLGDHELVHALTIHKSQGSQWGHVVVSLPDGPSRILTRELLYTAVTRATDLVTIIGDEATIAAAVALPIRRASGLADRLRTG